MLRDTMKRKSKRKYEIILNGSTCPQSFLMEGKGIKPKWNSMIN